MQKVESNNTENKYLVTVKGVTFDCYDLLKALNITCPAMQHAFKKVAYAGVRGHKNSKIDKEQAIQAIQRSLELDEA